jgi:hypothetical protein
MAFCCHLLADVTLNGATGSLGCNVYSTDILPATSGTCGEDVT